MSYLLGLVLAFDKAGQMAVLGGFAIKNGPGERAAGGRYHVGRGQLRIANQCRDHRACAEHGGSPDAGENAG